MSPEPVTTPSATAAQSNAEILRWQIRARLAFAALLAAIVGSLSLAGVEGSAGVPALGTVACYAIAVGALALLSSRRNESRTWLVAATVAADVLLIFSFTYVVAEPAYYYRALFCVLAVLHLTQFYFGRSLAAVALATSIVTYAAMVGHAIAGGAGVSWPQEALTLALFALVGSSFVYHYGNFRDRLDSLVGLFSRAEEGDFGDAYDAERDARPDTITRVGRAYNQLRAQLATMVLTDPLSGCLNRRGLEQQLTREIARAVRSKKEIALLTLDVDHFKSVNDTYGHLVGDAVIREVGALLREVARTGDVCARMGGDEFAILLPETTTEGALALAQRLRDAARGRRIPSLPSRAPRPTMSMGIVAGPVLDEHVAHDLHSRADQALYLAKAAGRDCARVWEPRRPVLAGGATAAEKIPRIEIRAPAPIGAPKSRTAR